MDVVGYLHHHLAVEPSVVTVHRHTPEDFLIFFQERSVLERVLGAPMPALLSDEPDTSFQNSEHGKSYFFPEGNGANRMYF